MIYATEAKLASHAKALGESASAGGFSELQDYCASESPLVRRIAASAIGKLSGVVNAKAAVELRDKAVVHHCSRCGVCVQPDEYARCQRFFQRIFCDACFDETATERRNWETKVEDKKTLRYASV